MGIFFKLYWHDGMLSRQKFIILSYINFVSIMYSLAGDIALMIVSWKTKKSQSRLFISDIVL